MDRSPQQVYSELLVLRCQRGEREAFAQLVELWQSRLLGQAISLCGERELALDVLQDSWLAIARGLSRLQDPASFPAWSYRILRNKAADAIGRISRERGRSADSDTEATAAALDADDPQLEELRLAIRQLPDAERELLRLHYMDGLSLADISGVLAIPAGTVKSRLFKARTRLRRQLEGAEHD
ncbi:RNA polymerase sigma factor [bacterium]|nr:RNA polymerase sigma factor [bacterium]